MIKTEALFMKRFTCLLLAAVLLSLAACHNDEKPKDTESGITVGTAGVTVPDTFPKLTNDVSISCTEGTAGCYSIEGDTILFTGIQEDSLYIISGEWNGRIVIDAGDNHKFELEMQGLSIAATTMNPITILGGDKVTLTAKKGYQNFIYDQRPAVSEEEYAGAIHAECDLTIGGKGSLTIISDNNNGIHTKDDLEVKNLTLFVFCTDNALKGNDSVILAGGNITLIARQGDGVKTSNSDISEKGKQRGTITVSGCTLNIYAACDGLDAAYDVIVEDGTTVLNIYTDRYSAYSETVDTNGSADDGDRYYICYGADVFTYSVKYYNSDTDYLWVDAAYHSQLSAGRGSWYIYSFPKLTGYSKIKYFGYMSGQTQGQEDDYAFCTDYLTVNTAYDTFAISARGNSLSYSWVNFADMENSGMGGPGGMGPGGMQEGNSDKGDYSTKGIKAANAVSISGGTVYIQSYDDAIHANQDTTLENGGTPAGDVTISGGDITLYSNDDGIHADGTTTIADGTVRIQNAFEGIEGSFVKITGGQICVISSDDGVNATATSGEAITVSGGYLYVYAGGDGLDSNCRDSYGGIGFYGGNTVVITASNGNSAIDSERGYSYTGGYVLAVTSAGGMSGETTNLSNLNSVGTKKNMSLTGGKFVQVKMGSDMVLTVKMPCSVNAMVVFLGDKDATITAASTSNTDLDANGVCWDQ